MDSNMKNSKKSHAHNRYEVVEDFGDFTSTHYAATLEEAKRVAMGCVAEWITDFTDGTYGTVSRSADEWDEMVDEFRVFVRRRTETESLWSPSTGDLALAGFLPVKDLSDGQYAAYAKTFGWRKTR